MNFLKVNLATKNSSPLSKFLTYLKGVISSEHKSFLTHLDEYCDYRKSTGVKDRTISHDRAKIIKMIAFTKKEKTKDIRGRDAENAKNTILQMPMNAHTMKVFRNNSAEEIIEKNKTYNYTKISTATAQDYAQKCSSFFKWAIKMEHTDLNPFLSMKFDKKLIKQNTKRHALTDMHFDKLFSLEQFQTSTPKENFQFWVLLIIRYTGMRLNEVCQLSVADIITQDGILCIRATLTFEGQSLKNANAFRLVPVADELLRLGFSQFVMSQDDRFIIDNTSLNTMF